jgi:hypothetical protein
MCSIWHNLKVVESGQYLIEVEIEVRIYIFSMKNEECMFGNGLKVGWLKPFQYISVSSLIAHDKSRIFTPVTEV